jgi:hypothetical protein
MAPPHHSQAKPLEPPLRQELTHQHHTMDPIRARISSPRTAADGGYLARILPAGFIMPPRQQPLMWEPPRRVLRPVAADSAIALS